jgi:hypothetical protein
LPAAGAAAIGDAQEMLRLVAVDEMLGRYDRLFAMLARHGAGRRRGAALQRSRLADVDACAYPSACGGSVH